ncbi:S-methyl-5-thioribose-1-phosphate isomerase [Yinghuangia aomiensis]|uniref:S-methyl-5-thioribose-1-phosphate isomerase n=1 Tax=Yinghuangia aomiensis TaxID=676205 RepID=A0ABP9I892_9ACTN
MPTLPSDAGWDPRPVFWSDDLPTAYGRGPAVVLLDRTRLPGAEARLVCSDVPALVDAIRRRVVDGGPLLGIAAAYGVALAAARGDDVEAAADALTRTDLGRTRDTAEPAPAVGARVHAAYDPTPAHPARETWRTSALASGARQAREAWRQSAHDPAAPLAAARALHTAVDRTSAALARQGARLAAELLPDRPLRVLTHGDTGALTHGGEGTAFAVARALHRAGRLARLHGGAAAALTAYEAERCGLPYAALPDPHTVTDPDVAFESLDALGGIDLVLVGAHRIAADGAVTNTAGTHALARRAARAGPRGIPVLVVAPVAAIDPRAPSEAAIVGGIRDAGEVTESSRRALATAGDASSDPAFDVTPPALICAIVTETGVLSPVTTIAIARMSAGHDPVMRR